MILEEPKTALEKLACTEAKGDAIAEVVSAKKEVYKAAMAEYMKKEASRRKLTEECADLEKKLGITEEDKVKLF